MIDKGISDGNTEMEIWDERLQIYVKELNVKCSQIISSHGTPFEENFDLIPGKTYRFKASTEGKWTQK